MKLMDWMAWLLQPISAPLAGLHWLLIRWGCGASSTILGNRGYVVLAWMIGIYFATYAVLESVYERRRTRAAFERSMFFSMATSGRREAWIAAVKLFGPVQTIEVPPEPLPHRPDEWAKWLTEPWPRPNLLPLWTWARESLRDCTPATCGEADGVHWRIGLRGADFRGAVMDDFYIRRELGRWTGDFSGVSMLHASLRNADLYSADMRDAIMPHAFFDGARLRSADLRNAYLVGAFMVGADLTSANLTGANLNLAHLRDAALHGANLSGALLLHSGVTQAQLDTACADPGNPPTIDLLAGWDTSGAGRARPVYLLPPPPCEESRTNEPPWMGPTRRSKLWVFPWAGAEPPLSQPRTQYTRPRPPGSDP